MNKVIKTAIIDGKAFILRYFPEHTSGNGHFPDDWEMTMVPAKGNAVRKRHFRSFVSAMNAFNKITSATA